MGTWKPKSGATSGNDVFTGDNSNETAEGGEGNDALYGNGGDDSLYGGAGSDTLYGGGGYNNLYAFDGFYAVNDTAVDYLYAGPLWNILHGGKGDHFIGNVSGDSIVYYYLRPNETVVDFRGVNAAGTGVAPNGTHFSNIDFISVNSQALKAVSLYGHEGADQLIGGQGNDRIFGFGYIDSLDGFFGDDTLDGGGGNDYLDGGEGADHLIGGAGDDSMDGGLAVDTLSGGVGDDIYRVDSTSDIVIESAASGIDRVRASSATYTLGANLENLEYVAYNDITYEIEARSFVGIGNALDNQISGGVKNDRLEGRGGDDVLFGDLGADTMIGGDGNDVFTVDNISDVVVEASNQGSNDTVFTYLSSYTLGANVDHLHYLAIYDSNVFTETNFTGIGNALDNTIIGGSKNDWLDGRAGADFLQGLDGDDVYVIDDAGDIVIENGGVDTIRTAFSSFTLPNLVENIVFTGAGAFAATGTIYSNRISGGGVSDLIDGAGGVDLFQARYASTNQPVVATLSSVTVGGVNVAALTSIERLDIVSGSGADRLTGGAYGDTFDGGAGNDTLDGGAGADIMIGGAGNDTYLVGSSGDVTTETSTSASLDRVFAWVHWTLGANIENLALYGSGALNGAGNSMSNLIIGNGAVNTLTGLAGHDALDGGAGADKMYGGVGNDTYYVDNVLDLVSEKANEGYDTIRATISFTAPVNFERVILDGAGDINAFGNTLANALIGNAGANTLNGAAGADTITGGDGNDSYCVDNSGDVVSETSPTGGVDRVLTIISHTLGANVENLVLQGSAAINGTGNSLNNAITGNAAANILNGGAGNDTLNGAAGADTMIGGTGDDRYFVDAPRDVVTENASAGTDTVYSSISYMLSANVENLVLLGSAALAGTGNSLNNALVGNAAANTLIAGVGNDTLNGGGGADILIGGRGADLIDGGAGADTMEGGADDDLYYVDDIGDVVVEAASAGHDSVITSVSYTLSANVEGMAMASGAANIDGTGNALDNIINGNDGDNAIDVQAGNDRINAGLGNDTLTGGSGADVFHLRGSLGAGNIDTITDFTSGEDTIELSDTVFSALFSPTGKLLLENFVSAHGATAALDADDFILHDQDTGALYYDSDGLGGDAAILFAYLQIGATPVAGNSGDFVITS